MPSTTNRDERSGIDGFRGRNVVVVTPVALDSDSRTRKQVMSLMRWGAKVTVYAGGQLIPGEQIAARPEARAVQSQSTGKARPRWIAAPWAWVRRTRTPAVFLLPVFALWLAGFYWRTFFVAGRKIPAGADLYILHEFGHFPAVARAAGDSPIIYDAHDFYTAIEPDDAKGSFDRKLLVPFNRKLERRCVARANAILTVSDGLARLYADAYSRTPVVVRNCHDQRLDATGVPALKDRLKLSSEAFVIVIAGNWKPGQELQPLLETLASTPGDIHLACVGGGYDRLDATIDRLGLRGRVHPFGRLPASEIVPALAGADAAAVVYYARSENYRSALPNGFFQSIAAGLPVLYPDLPEIRAIAEQGELGVLVDWTSEPAISAAIAELSNNTQRYRQLRGNAEKAARELSWEKEELVLADALTKCLAPREPTSK